MKIIAIKYFFLVIIFLALLCRYEYAQMPPHPSLLERISRGEQPAPFTLSNLNLIGSNGIDEAWASPKLQMLKKQNTFSRSFGPSALPSGSWKALAVLVKFSDKPSQAGAGYFDSLLFGQSTGTLHDYYEKISYGNLDIVTINSPSSLGWITAPQPYSYYVNGQNGMGSYPQNSQKLVEDIVNLVDPQIDFSRYDNDGDGFVDALFIVHSGSGADYTGNDNDIWSHSWATHTLPVLDGVKIFRYSIEPEFWQSPGDMTCGVFAHEMGHSVFGLPDLYDTDYSSYGLGNWSLMAGGSWNGTLGNSPAFPDAWSHAQMGYRLPTIVSSNISGQMLNMIENIPETYLLQNNLCGSEYFLVENRHKSGYDSFLPRGGLCIYHVDDAVMTGNNNEWYPGNTSSGHYHVALVQADGKWSLERNIDLGNSGDPFPGSSNNRNFSSQKIPYSWNYNLDETGIGVHNIVGSTIITADFKIDTQIQLPQFSPQLLIPLSGVDCGSVKWGDYDNDGYLDILLTGVNASLHGNGSIYSKIYHNNGDNRFIEEGLISLSDVYAGSIAWGDYDNDGSLDILLTGNTAQSIPITKIYHNNGDNTFAEETSISLIGVFESSAAWLDYDNDGDLDILITGSTGSNNISKIYRNDGSNSFSEQTLISLTGVRSGSVALGDYDNDRSVDILLTGYDNTNHLTSKIYHNNGDNTFEEQNAISLIDLYSGSAAWGDYDNDGYLDILLTGETASGTNLSKIYHNNGDNSFSEQTSISLTGVRFSSASWGDYDNDGDLDILLSGFVSLLVGSVSKIYRNDGDNTFTEQTSFTLFGMESSSAAWGDYDNDGDLDFIIAGLWGSDDLSLIYRSNNSIQNILPGEPSGLKTVITGNDVTFSWDKSTDNETPQDGLTYNLAIGTSPGSCDILSPMSDLNTGKRRIVDIGNAGHCNSKIITGLQYGKYYWSVQTIDNAFAGSAFAETKSFVIQAPQTIIVTSPSGGEQWEVGSNPIITYSSLGNSGYVNLDYSTDGGATWDTIAVNQLDDGDYKGWLVPNTPSANCKVRIRDVDGNPSAVSDSTFTIIKAVPAELISFSADIDKNKIILSWKTASERNNKGFEIERMHDHWEKIGYREGAGTSIIENCYSFSDNNLSVSGIYKYRLKQINYDGTFKYSDEAAAEINLIPDKLTLNQNYPNPFNPVTTIRYGLPDDSDVKLVIYGILGNEAAVLVNGKKSAGTYDISFDGSNLSNGVYICMLQAGSNIQIRKMVLLK